MRASYFKHSLKFLIPSGTSRGVLSEKESWFIIIKEENKIGIGECSIIKGLSPDPFFEIEKNLDFICQNIQLGFKELSKTIESFPSIIFGLETAFLSLESANPFEFENSSFVSGLKNIPINGLIWMSNFSEMKLQIKKKIESGFDCIKIKVGSLDLKLECQLLKQFRNEFKKSDIEIRLDANGAFKYEIAMDRLKKLSDYDIHSIEQPIATKQWDKMSLICEHSPIDIALDEELIGIESEIEKNDFLEKINPSYIILKPSLLGGLSKTDSWIKAANSLNIGWWSTSALESNVGLNAISQWVFNKNTKLYQGLGTGGLYSNNIDCPLFIKQGKLCYDTKKKWDLNFFKNI